MKFLVIDDCRKCPHSGDKQWRYPYCPHAKRTGEIKDHDYVYVPGPECPLPEYEETENLLQGPFSHYLREMKTG
ncbi:MAG: hypothetical protein MUP81_02570 [Dehalococcoidia bacterium]|nr:hypothetical protein [Dehalococcoidia bacterium]